MPITQTIGLALVLTVLCGCRTTPAYQEVGMDDVVVTPSLVPDAEVALPETLDAAWIREHLTPGHPRLLADGSTWASLRERAERDATLAHWLDDLRLVAAEMLSKPPVQRRLAGRRMLTVSREALERLTVCAMVYRLDGDRAYLSRAEDELRAVIAFEDWNPSHFLDTAEMAAGVALGYDWLYDELPEGLRGEIREALWDKALSHVLAEDAATMWWTDATNNWNSVCWAGMTLAVLAIADDQPENAATVLAMVKRNNPAALSTYAPDGVYPEGPTYWSYGTSFQVLLLDALRTAVGTDLGLYEREPGFTKADRFLIHATGPTGLTFNFADASSTAQRYTEPALEWFMGRRGQREHTIATEPLPEGSPYRTAGRLETMRILWYARSAGSVDETRRPALPLAWSGDGPQPVAMFRSAWDDPRAAYLATKGGRASVNHGHMDAGSFVLDARGVRWAHDLGKQDYHRLESQGVELWNRAQDGERWTLFRFGPFSHNTLTVDGELHRVDATGTLEHFAWSAPRGEARYALDDVLPGVDRWRRSFGFDGADEATVRDRLDGVRPHARIRWAMLTRATIEVDAHGRSATLRQDGQTLRVFFTGPDGFAISQAPAAGDPPLPFDEPNAGVAVLLIAGPAPADGTVALDVTLRWAD